MSVVAAGAIGVAVELGALAPHRGVARAGGSVLDQRAPRAVGVERAQRDRPVRDATRAVGGSVDRIEHDGQLGVDGAGPARLLAEHAQTRRVQHREHRGIGDEVEAVLAGAIGARAAFGRAERGERAALRRGGDVEHGEEIVGRHRGAASTVTTAL